MFRITDQNSKTYATLSYALVMVVLGLPVWWQTTDVERAPLPFDRIEEMNQENLKQVVPITIVSMSPDHLGDVSKCFSGTNNKFQIIYTKTGKYEKVVKRFFRIPSHNQFYFLLLKNHHYMILMFKNVAILPRKRQFLQSRPIYLD